MLHDLLPQLLSNQAQAFRNLASDAKESKLMIIIFDLN